MQRPSSFQYDAFISYSRRDARFAAELEKKLENYRPPKGIRSHKLNVFRDVQDLKGNRLTEALQEAIQRSRHLIVLCSPDARRSKWVDKEIDAFVAHHGADAVIPVLVAGAPPDEAADEEYNAFPEALITHLLDALAVDYRWAENERSRDRRIRYREAFFQLLAFLFDTEKENLVQRQQARARRFAGLGIGAVLLIGSLVGWLNYDRNEKQKTVAVQSQQVASQRFLLQAKRADAWSVERIILSIEAYRQTPSNAAFSELRNIMYDYSELIRTIYGHEENREGDASVNSAVFSSDGTRIVSGGSDGAVRVWDAKTGAPLGDPVLIRRPRGLDPARIDDVLISRDGTKIFALDQMGRLYPLSLSSTSNNVALLAGEPLGIKAECMALSPVGNRLVTGDRNGLLTLWDLDTEEAIQNVTAIEEGYRCYLALGGTRVAAGSDKVVRIFDLESGDQLREIIPGEEDSSLESLAISVDGSLLVTATDDGLIRVWDTATGEQQGRPMRGHQGDGYYGIAIHRVAFSPNSQHIMSSGEDGTIRIWDLETGFQVGRPIRGHKRILTDDISVYSAAYSKDGEYIVSGGSDGTVRIWDAVPGEQEDILFNSHSRIYGVAYSPDGALIASTGADGLIHVQHTETGEWLHTRERAKRDAALEGLVFTPDGTRIVTAESKGIVQVWEVASGLPIGEPLSGHGRDGQGGWNVYGVATSPDGRLIASAGGDGTVRIWDLDTGKQRGEPLYGHVGGDMGNEWVKSIAFSPDGTYIVSGGRDGGIILWDASTGELIGRPWYGHGVNFAQAYERGIVSSRDDASAYNDAVVYIEASVNGVAFSPDGRRVVSGGIDGALLLWDVQTGKQIGEPWRLLVGDEDGDHMIHSVAYSPDGRRVVSGGNKGLHLWDAETGEPLGKPLSGHEVYSVAFSLDGRNVISGGRDGTVRLWKIEPEVWIERACGIAGRNLTESEWSSLVGEAVPYRATCSEYVAQ